MAALAHAADSEVEWRSRANDFEARIGAVATADLAQVHRQAFLLGIKGLRRAQFLRQGQPLVIEAPLPDDLQALLVELRHYRAVR